MTYKYKYGLGINPESKGFFMGIDPGLTGGIAVLNNVGDLALALPMPVKGKYINLKELEKALAPFKNELFCIIEHVHGGVFGSVRKQGAVSAFNFGMNYGVLLTFLELNHIPHDSIEPKLWKSRFNLNNDKKNSILLANQLFRLGLNSKQDGTAEAILLAVYAMKEGQYLMRANK